MCAIVVHPSLIVVLLPGQPGNFLPTTGRVKDSALYYGGYQRGQKVYRENLSFERTRLAFVTVKDYICRDNYVICILACRANI